MPPSRSSVRWSSWVERPGSIDMPVCFDGPRSSYPIVNLAEARASAPMSSSAGSVLPPGCPPHRLERRDVVRVEDGTGAHTRDPLAGLGDVVEGLDGAYGWDLSAVTEPMLRAGIELEERRLDSDFDSELTDESRYSSITTVEQTQFAERPCYKVRLARNAGTEDIEFYDVSTGLKAGSTRVRQSPRGAVTRTRRSLRVDERQRLIRHHSQIGDNGVRFEGVADGAMSAAWAQDCRCSRRR